MYAGKPGDFGTTWPGLASSTGLVNLWLGHTRFGQQELQEMAAKGLEKLGKDAAGTFPVRFRTRAKVGGGIMEFSIDSFLATDENKSLVKVH